MVNVHFLSVSNVLLLPNQTSFVGFIIQKISDTEANEVTGNPVDSLGQIR